MRGITNCESLNKSVKSYIEGYSQQLLMSFLKANLPKNYELAKQKVRIARYGIDKLSYELAKIRIAKATNCEVYL